MKTERVIADFKQAAALLRDKNLVWSADLDSIREELAEYIESKATLGNSNNPHLIAVVQRLIADENDLSI
jgi:ribosomal protein L29